MKTKIHEGIILILVFSGGLLVFDYLFTSHRERSYTVEELTTERVATHYMSVTLPNQRWRKEEIHSTAFQYAKLSNEDITISVYTNSKANDLNVDEEDYIIEHRNINGNNVKIVIPKQWSGVTGMTYTRGGSRITFEAHDLTRQQKEKVLMIFETVH